MTANRRYDWDCHSDQPHVIRDRRLKRRLYLLGAVGSLKTLLTFLLVLPAAALIRYARRRRTLPANASTIGLGVNVESALAEKSLVPQTALAAAVEELGIQHLLLRVSLGEPYRLESVLALAEQFAGKKLLIDVLQDRAHIENRELLVEDLRLLFCTFLPYTNTFKIGNAVNRRKWAFDSLDEYLAFFCAAQHLRDREFPQIRLLGGGIIDFELPNFARSVLHFHPIRYDAVAALLYVDRRGAPENHQLGSNLLGKISWFRSLMWLSNKCDDRLLITETNWPLLHTEPFAPAVGACMVDEDRQAAYLSRYYLLAFASGQVEAVYWHQLVAPGYGLIDNRGDEVRRRKAYYALKTLSSFFAQSVITGFEQREGVYVLTAEQGRRHVTAVWTNDVDTAFEASALPPAGASPAARISAYSLTGEEMGEAAAFTVNGDVTYFVRQLGS
ncbi:MAG: hypothetical protein V2I24_02100 [Halieaceae bacterium]|jgi:hypothetical protein|nr:hypothetical protein [Halieaceae bacterium]